MVWRVVAYEQNLGLAAAMKHLQVAKDKQLHLVEPRLALMVCQQLLETVDLDEAATVAEAVLVNRTTDTVFDDLELWLIWTKQSAAAVTRAAKPPQGQVPEDGPSGGPSELQPLRANLTGQAPGPPREVVGVTWPASSGVGYAAPLTAGCPRCRRQLPHRYTKQYKTVELDRPTLRGLRRPPYEVVGVNRGNLALRNVLAATPMMPTVTQTSLR
jgi:hypothetical protein